ncbi:MAG TPA: serine/threonine-protein kinase [Myxococcales bacterium]|nr:serine/threonine-protein kinase [Myxococcales bacterium]
MSKFDVEGESTPVPSACPGCGRPGSAARCGFCGVSFSAGPYRVERILGQGASGRVYRAVAPDGTVIALKELQFSTVPGAQQIDAFEREAATLKTLHHPRIPRFIASFQEGEGVQLRLYLAAEFIEGEALSARIARGPLAEAELRDVAAQVLQVLAYLHKLGVLHRDIKPDNLIVRPGGELVLVDFGSARKLQGSRTFGATLVGTFGYMPTEQLGGTVDATSDLYALGATLLHAATGKPPSELLAGDFSLRVPAGIPLRDLIARLVQPRRDRRLRSAEAALAALENPPRPAAVRPRFAAVAAAALVAGALIVSSLSRASTSSSVHSSLPGQPRQGTNAQQWFARAKPFCNPVEVAQFMARNPAAPGRDGAGFAAGCWALAGKIDEARTVLAGVPEPERWRAAGIVFDLAHPVADAGDDVAAARIMNLVLESWPNNYMALYHAGMSDFALGNRDRARTHLKEFLRLYATEDGFRRNAKDALTRMGESADRVKATR